jgi:hypothetical protein
METQNNISQIQELSEKTGIEMIVIDEAHKITGVPAKHFKRQLIGSRYISDPIQSNIQQQYPRTKTVLLPGISFLINHSLAEQMVSSLNKKFAYRSCIAFISDDQTRVDKKHTISLIRSTDKYNTLRLQETSGGSYHFSTDSLIAKLKDFELKYPFQFIGVGSDWLLLKTIDEPKDWSDYAGAVMKVCPNEETNINEMAEALQKDKGRVSMWWD